LGRGGSRYDTYDQGLMSVPGIREYGNTNVNDDSINIEYTSYAL